MKLIVGLGNPGKSYEYTRHNLGFLTLKSLSERFKLNFSLSSFTKGVFSKFIWKGFEVALLLPMTYMNNSGIAVKQFMQTNDIDLDSLLVICDDLNLDFGQIRIRAKGSDGGHNGLSSIIYHLNTESFARLRMGIGLPPEGYDSSDFVLDQFTPGEKKQLSSFINRGIDCSLLWAEDSIQKAMDTYNRRKENGEN